MGVWDGRTYTWPVRVYYHHTDAGGVVYHGPTSTSWRRRVPSSCTHTVSNLAEVVERESVLFMVYRLAVDYHKSARLNEALRVTATIAHAGRVLSRH